MSISCPVSSQNPGLLSVSLLSFSLVRMIVVVSALRKEQMKSEEIVSLENTLGDIENVEKEL